MKVFDEVLQKEVEIQDIVTPENGKEGAYEEILPKKEEKEDA